MPIPSETPLGETLLMYIYFHKNNAVIPRFAYKALAIFYNLSQSELADLHQKSEISVWKTAVRSAREKLAKEGYIFRPDEAIRNYWKLTPNGVREANRTMRKFGSGALEQLKAIIQKAVDEGDASLPDIF